MCRADYQLDNISVILTRDLSIGRHSRDWLTNEPEASGGTDYSHHLTIGPHGGVDWVRRLGLEPGGRKSSDSEITGAAAIREGREEELPLHRSTDCIVSKELASSSDSDLLRYRKKNLDIYMYNFFLDKRNASRFTKF